MSVSNAAVFECRPATGNDLNSGGYVTGGGGTDFSQQAAAQATFNGSTVTATTSGVSATISITGYTVSAADKGNLLRIAMGTNFTAGLYQITNFNAGTNTWTLDRNVSTGVASAMVGRMGGALATLVQFFFDADNYMANPGGNVCYITGTYTVTAAVAITAIYANNAANSNTASNLGGIAVIGYNATRGDNGHFTFTTATNSVDLIHYGTNCRNVAFYNCSFTTTAGTPATGVTTATNASTPAKMSFINCSWSGGFTYAIFSDQASNGAAIVGLFLQNCTITGCTTGGIYVTSLTVLMDCYIYSNTGDGLHMATNGGSNTRTVAICIRSIFYGNTGAGVNNASQANTPLVSDQVNIFTNCCFVSNTGDGLKIGVPSGNGLMSIMMENCISYGNGGFGLNITTLYGVLIGGYNAYGSNTSGAYGNSALALTGDVTLSGDPFNGRTSNDFSLNGTAGAGAACKNAGFPGALQNGGTGSESIGALAPSSGGSTTEIVPNKVVYTFLGRRGY